MMAIVMMVVGFTVVAADGSDAASTDIPKVSVDVDAEEVSSDNFAINEGNYRHYDYTLTWTFAVGRSSETFAQITEETDDSYSSGSLEVSSSMVGSSIDNENFTVKLIRDSEDIGIYHLAFDGITATETDIIYTLTATIDVTVNGTKAAIDPVVFNGSVAVYQLEGGDGGNISVNIASGAKVGEYYNEQIEIKTPGLSVEDYQWYAVKLPAGLTMSIDGYVSGIPTAKGDNLSFTVFATDVDGNVFYGTVSNFAVSAKDPTTPSVTGFKYTVNDSSGGPFIVEAGDNIILKVTSTQEGQNEIDDATVTVINASGLSATTEIGYTIEDPTHPKSGYYLPNTGSGAYQVTIVVDDETAWFTVYVIGAFGAIEPSIVISGA